MAKDYYLTLGVPLDASPGEIRSAFRKLALRYHPDRRRDMSPGTFQDISEAYGVLSDPVQRAGYDRESRRRGQRVAAVPVTSRSRDPEPLISEPVPITGRPETVRPSYDALLDRLRRNFASAVTPNADREEPLNFELILSADEAARGIRVPFRVPVFSACPGCGGTGRGWLVACTDCGGEGRMVDEGTVNVRVPGGVRDGTVIELSLEKLGIYNLWLRVHVRVERH